MGRARRSEHVFFIFYPNMKPTHTHKCTRLFMLIWEIREREREREIVVVVVASIFVTEQGVFMTLTTSSPLRFPLRQVLHSHNFSFRFGGKRIRLLLVKRISLLLGWIFKFGFGIFGLWDMMIDEFFGLFFLWVFWIF